MVVQEIAGWAIQFRFSARHLAAIGFNKANVHVFNNIMLGLKQNAILAITALTE